MSAVTVALCSLGVRCAVHHSGAQYTHFVYEQCALCVVLFKCRSHGLPVVVGRVAAGGGGGHDERADRGGKNGGHIAMEDALHLVYIRSNF